MNTSYEEYVGMLQAFLSHDLSPEQFRDDFSARFLNESGDMDETLFLLLDQLFGALDCYTEDQTLLGDDPVFYLDLETLRREAAQILHGLQAWRGVSAGSSRAAVDAMLAIEKVEGVTDQQVLDWIAQGRQ